MGKIILIMMMIAIIISCQPSSTVQVSNNYEIEAFIDTFMETHSSYFNNDITKQHGDSLFYAHVILSLPDSILNEFPLKLNGVKMFDNSYYAHFSTGVSGIELNKSTLYYDVIAMIPKQAADTLKDENYYYMNIHPVQWINLSMLEMYSNSWCYSPLIKIRPDDIFKDKKEVTIGVFIADICGLKYR